MQDNHISHVLRSRKYKTLNAFVYSLCSAVWLLVQTRLIGNIGLVQSLPQIDGVIGAATRITLSMYVQFPVSMSKISPLGNTSQCCT